MVKTKLLNKIVKHRTDIVGIRLDGTYYDISFIDADVSDTESLVIYAYQLDEGMTLEYTFNLEDIEKAKTVILYKLQEI